MADYFHSLFNQANANPIANPQAGSVAGYLKPTVTDAQYQLSNNMLRIAADGEDFLRYCDAGGTVQYVAPAAGMFVLGKFLSQGPFAPFDLGLTVTGDDYWAHWRMDYATLSVLYEEGAVRVVPWTFAWTNCFGPPPVAGTGYVGHLGLDLCLFIRDVRGAAATLECLMEYWVKAPWIAPFTPAGDRWLCVMKSWQPTPSAAVTLVLRGGTSALILFVSELRFGVGTFDPASAIGSGRYVSDSQSVAGVAKTGIIYSSMAALPSGRIAIVHDDGANESAATGFDVRLHVSDDADRHDWTEITPDATRLFAAAGGYMYTMGALASDGNTLICIAGKEAETSHDDWSVGVRVSTDGGDTWSAIVNPAAPVHAGAATPGLFVGRNGVRTPLGRWVFPVGDNGGNTWLLWSDVAVPDAAEDWNVFDLGFAGKSDGPIAVLPNGNLFFLGRQATHEYYAIVSESAADPYFVVEESGNCDGLAGRPLITTFADPMAMCPYPVFGKIILVRGGTAFYSRRAHYQALSSTDGITWTVIGNGRNPLIEGESSPSGLDAISVARHGNDLTFAVSPGRNPLLAVPLTDFFLPEAWMTRHRPPRPPFVG